MSKKAISCEVEDTLKVITGRWKVLIIQQLLTGVKRFNELQRSLKGISHKTLSRQLREMEAQGIVVRKVYPQIPPKVEYALSPLGLSLQGILEAMHEWALRHGREVSSSGAAARRKRST